MTDQDDGSFDYSNMGRRPKLVLETCALQVMRAAGVDLQELRERLISLDKAQFKTMPNPTREQGVTNIRHCSLPGMKGRRIMTFERDEIVFEEIDMGNGLKYVAIGSSDGGATVHLQVITEELPETIMLGIVGMPVASLISHQWLTDQGITVLEARNATTNLYLRVEPTWTELE